MSADPATIEEKKYGLACSYIIYLLLMVVLMQNFASLKIYEFLVAVVPHHTPCLIGQPHSAPVAFWPHSLWSSQV